APLGRARRARTGARLPPRLRARRTAAGLGRWPLRGSARARLWSRRRAVRDRRHVRIARRARPAPGARRARTAPSRHGAGGRRRGRRQGRSRAAARARTLSGPARGRVGQRQRRLRAPDVTAVDLVMLACCDLGGIVRGRSLPAAELPAHLETGVGSVPANHALTPLGGLAEPNPFGSTGDLRLLPDRRTHTRIDGDEATSAFELVLCDIVETDGSPWECCPRTFLRRALEELESELGATLHASFEHEFQLVSPRAPALPFSFEAQRLPGPVPPLRIGGPPRPPPRAPRAL